MLPIETTTIHRPRWVFGAAEACVHPGHAAVEPLVTAVFYARIEKRPSRMTLFNFILQGKSIKS